MSGYNFYDDVMNTYGGPPSMSDSDVTNYLYSQEPGAYNDTPPDMSGFDYGTATDDGTTAGVNAQIGQQGGGFDLQKMLGSLFSGAGGGMGTKGLVALLGALAARRSRQGATGGGTTQAYAGPGQVNRTMVQGRYGPIAQYAATGGLMRAYAQGGTVRPFPMQDGGFVMTKRAVDGAGGPGGMQQRIPEARPIVGPGHGTSDSIPAYIQGPNGRTPAKVSNGEMYVPPGRNPQGLQALMKALERKG